MSAGESTGDPFDLVLKGRSAQAVDLYSKLLKEEPDNELRLLGRAIAHVNLGALEQAAADFGKAEALNHGRAIGRSSQHATWLGIVDWLRGQRADALRRWLVVVSEIQKGRVVYADMAGGVQPAALPWYGASRIGVAAAQELQVATRFLTKRVKGSGLDSWPAPIGAYLLGAVKEEELLQRAGDVAASTRRDRRLCQATFYIAAMAQSLNFSERAAAMWARAVNYGDLFDGEHYLAQGELTNTESAGTSPGGT